MLTQFQRNVLAHEVKKAHAISVRLTEIELNQRPRSEALGLLKVSHQINLRLARLLQQQEKV